MPSPDFRSWIDLTIYDKSAQEIIDAALVYMATQIPDWVPREGNVEMVLLEAMAFALADTTFAINRLPNSVAEILLLFLGVTRDIGTQPVATLQFTVLQSTADIVIPAGTSALLTILDGIDPVVFSTQGDLTIPAGSTTGSTQATGDRYTDDANAATAGTELALIDTISQVDQIVLVSIDTLGAEQEDDEAWLDRGTQRFSELSDTLCLARQFQASALENPEVIRALAIDSYNPASGNPPGQDGGHVTIAVYGAGATIPAAEKALFVSQLTAKAQANLAVHMIDATIETLNVTCTVVTDLGYDTATVQANVEYELQTYLSYQLWDWSTTVRYNNLLAVIGNAEGVAYVSSLTAPSGDVTYTDVAPLVEAGTINVSVVTQ